MSDTFAGTIRTVMRWNRTQERDLGSTVNAQTDQRTYEITDGDGPEEADLVYAATRTIPGQTIEEIDLSDLDQTKFGVTVPYEFAQLRMIRIRNDEVETGQVLRVGVDPGRPSVVYAVEVGPSSEWFSINHKDAWLINENNKLLYIANPSATAVTYTLWLIGSSTV